MTGENSKLKEIKTTDIVFGMFFRLILLGLMGCIIGTFLLVE